MVQVKMMLKKVKLNRVTSIDETLLEKLQKGDYSIHSVFNHTMNAIYNNHLITFGTDTLPKGINNITTTITDFYESYCQGDMIKVENSTIIIGEHRILLDSKSIHRYQMYKDTYVIAHIHIYNALQLIEFVKKSGIQSVFKYDEKNITQRYQFDKIAAFLFCPTLETAKNIVGLGVGLTPMGDDVLTGYIFAKQAIGKTVLWTEDLLKFAKNKTNAISLKSLYEITSYQYSDYLIRILKDFFINNRLDVIKEWIDFGATSGSALLTGFSIGILEEEMKYETLQNL